MKKRIVVNGREYGSVDEMPPEVRRTYQEVMAGLGEGGAPSSGTRVREGRLADESLERVEVTSSRKIVVDGREYDDVDDLPPEARALYDRLAEGSQAAERVEVVEVVEVSGTGISSATPTAPRVGAGSAELDEERVHAMLRSAEPRRTPLSRGVGMAVAFGVVLVFVLLMLVLGSL